MAYRRTPQVQARLDATRDRIVVAAVQRIATGGWSALTVASVARDAQVATGTVYRHFDDKDALLAAAFRRAAGRELTEVARAAEGSTAALERLESALRVFAERALRGPRLAYALLAEPAGPTVEAERLIYRRGYRQVFAEVLADGVADGSLVPHDVEVVAAALVGASGEVLVEPLAATTGATADPLADPLADPYADPAGRTEALVAACLRAVPTTSTGSTTSTGPAAHTTRATSAAAAVREPPA